MCVCARVFHAAIKAILNKLKWNRIVFVIHCLHCIVSIHTSLYPLPTSSWETCGIFLSWILNACPWSGGDFFLGGGGDKIYLLCTDITPDTVTPYHCQFAWKGLHNIKRQTTNTQVTWKKRVTKIKALGEVGSMDHYWLSSNHHLSHTLVITGFAMLKITPC